jgi:hypothetical protein
LVAQGNDSGELLRYAEQREWPIETTKFLLGNTFALAGLTPKGKSEPGVATFVEAHSIVDSFKDTHDVERSVFLIDMGTKVASLVGLVAIWGEMPVEHVISDLEEWSHDVLEELLASVDDFHS